jgi:UDP-N-acetyl-D-mannosaminuronic acid dehydrogenase
MRKVTVIGIGRVGLPFALYIASKNFHVSGVGRNEEKINELKKGKMPFVEEGADLLRKHVNKNFIPTTSYDVVKSSNILILTLGTPIDENMNPVLDQINDALLKIIPNLRKNQLIILRSTVSPQTTIYVKDTIELATKFKVGKDLFIAYCPERIAEGKSITETKTIPQIVGGVDEISTRKALAFFKELKVKTIPTDSTSAELSKLFTNMYRYINFAISNEFMVVAENFNRNIHEIINLVNHDYKRGGLALPGLTGGPCLFKDGFFLVNDNPYSDLITTSWKINEAIPLFLINKLKSYTSLKGKTIAILGVAFKPEIDDTRESLSFKIRKALLREHAKVILHDPFVKKYEQQEIKKDYKEALKGADIVIVATKHNQYKRNKEEILRLIEKNMFIVDVWNVFETNQIIFKKTS